MAHVNSRRSFLQSAAAGAALLLPACRRAADDAPTPAVAPAGALRIDLRHSVRDGAHAFEPLRFRREPHWPRGADVELPDWGEFRVSAIGPGNTLLYREGFESSIDAEGRAALTELSVRVPMPASAARVVIEKRRAGNTFLEVAAFDVDPRASAIDAAPAALDARIDTLLSSTGPGSKAKLAILGDGYRETEYLKFVADARRAVEYLFSVEPFARRASDFNVVSVFTASGDSGITDPYLERRRDTLFRCRYGEGTAERTLFAGDNTTLREAASLVPYDFLLVLANARRYGGSAYFGGPAVVAIDSAGARYLVLHELGHAIAGLAEEYYIPDGDGPVYGGNVEPWQPNVTLGLSSGKWRTDAARATPWNKAEYDREFAKYVRAYRRLRQRRAGEQAVEMLMRVAGERQRALLAKNAPLRTVGHFEGAHGHARGVYRAEVDCIMFSLQTRYYCSACEAALERSITALL
ncbi:MAG TPA: M64 family metallopeptidase [Burkholderiales bacterium]|nr:M64 family metallopeptidase [Burkholderiales bacterium]